MYATTKPKPKASTMSARGLRVVMFDLDGSLVDTMGAFADLAAEVMAQRHGLDRALARRRYLETSGIPFHQQLERAHADAVLARERWWA